MVSMDASVGRIADGKENVTTPMPRMRDYSTNKELST